jgi:immune inhibitor A
MTAKGDRCPKTLSVPPSPELEKRLLRTKKKFLAGEPLPKDATAELLDLQSFSLIVHRPAHTRAHTLAPAAPQAAPAVGTRRALVLLVDFSDKPASLDADHFRQMLFSQGTYPTGSLSDYYREASYQQLNIQGEVRGWYRAPHPYSYYVGNKYGFGDYPGNAYKLAEDVVEIASRDIDFAKYDMDGDGQADALFIVHAGPGAEASGSTSDIWSHMSSIPAQQRNGTTVSRYSMEPEDGKIGVFCHELGHVFGLPDLYDIDMDSAGTGWWDLMAGGSWNNNGLTPAHLIAWCKVRLGWVKPIAPSMQTITVRPSTEYPDIYRLGPEGQEYFLIENRERKGFDASLPGEGLLVMHVDESRSNNNDQNHYLVGILQCDGRRDLEKNANRGDAGDPYPSASNNAFAADTDPCSHLYNGKDSGVSLAKISRNGDTITLNTSVGARSDAVWHNDQSIKLVFVRSKGEAAWALASTLGWRRVKKMSDGKLNEAYQLCCRAVADDLKVKLLADGAYIYGASLASG